MKPLFGFDKTNNKPSKASEYVTKTISKALENEYDEITQISFNIHKKLENKLKKYSKYIIFFGAVLVISCILLAIKDNSFSQMWEQRKIVLIVGGIALVAGIAARIISNFIKPKKELLEDLEWNKKELENWMQKRADFFEFDENIYKIDILHAMFTIKKGEVKPILTFGTYNNVPTVMFIKNGNFCVSDNINVYEFPLEYFKEVVEIEEKKAFSNWTQKEEYTQEYANSIDGAVVKKGITYHITKCKRVIFDIDGEEYYFEIIPYDFEKMDELVNQINISKPLMIDLEEENEEENLFELREEENEK